jgi:uncharacterized Zn finger protein (UPF0148 family)
VKAWEVIAVAHDGEIVCPDCYTDAERRVANDASDENDDENEEITPVFASNEIEEDECCGRCGERL